MFCCHIYLTIKGHWKTSQDYGRLVNIIYIHFFQILSTLTLYYCRDWSVHPPEGIYHGPRIIEYAIGVDQCFLMEVDAKEKFVSSNTNKMRLFLSLLAHQARYMPLNHFDWRKVLVKKRWGLGIDFGNKESCHVIFNFLLIFLPFLKIFM